MNGQAIERRKEEAGWITRAEEEIFATYGVRVSVAAKNKTLLKFGRNEAVGTTEELVWLQGGTETLPTTNAIDKISSSNAGDTQAIKVEGHTISGSDLTFVVQSATLAGQTETALGTPLARATRIYNNDSTDFAGTVYVYEDDTVTSGVPQTAAKIHLSTGGAENQSLKAATSVSSVDYWIIRQIYASVNEKTTAAVDFRYQTRLSGKVFRTQVQGAASSSGAHFYAALDPPMFVPANADFRIMATASTSNVSVDAWANGVLAIAI